MELIKKYDKKKLKQVLNFLTGKIYLFFYDLDCKEFNKTLNMFAKLMQIDEYAEILINKQEHLIIFGCLDPVRIECFVDELSAMDIGEYDISEYLDKQVVVAQLANRQFIQDNMRSIYVNNDERVIQTYNFN